MAAVLLPDLRTQARGELIVAGVLVLGVGGLITIWGISRVAASRRKGFFVAITPAGLWIRSPTDEELVEWGDYRDVMISTVGTFARRRSTIRSINLSGVLDDGDDLAGFQEALLEAEERYRKGTDPPSGPS